MANSTCSGLLKREKEVAVARSEVASMKNNLALERRNLHIDTSKLHLQFQNVMNEKAKVHKVLLDINSQNDAVRKAIGLLPFSLMGGASGGLHVAAGSSKLRAALDGSLDGSGDRSLVAYDCGAEANPNLTFNSTLSTSGMVNANSRLLAMKSTDSRQLDHRVVGGIDTMTTSVHRNVDRDIDVVVNSDFGSTPLSTVGFSLGSTLSSLQSIGSRDVVLAALGSRQAASEASFQNIMNNLSTVAVANGQQEQESWPGDGYVGYAKVGLESESLQPGCNYSLSLDNFRESSDSLLKIASKYA